MARSMLPPSFILPVLCLFSLKLSAPLDAQPAQTNISLGSSVAASDGAAWHSPTGHFALGFYPKAQGLVIGVWLATSPHRTVVWTANRDDPPISNGRLWLTFDGRLVWSAPGGVEKTISSASEPAAVAAITDSGYFALYNSEGIIIWSTSESLTDTLLPGQSLETRNQLFSSVSETDRSTGKYRLINQDDANLVAYPVGTTNDIDNAYWDAGTFQIGFPLSLQFDKTGLLYLSRKNGDYIKNITQPESFSSGVGIQVYFRAVIDVDGILRVYSHSFSRNGNSTARVEWAALDNQCLVRGVCPLNSYCSLGADREPTCLCPPGFDFVDPNQISLGCDAKSSIEEYCSSAVLNASSGDHGGGNLTMATLANTMWVNKPYFILPSSMSVEDCKAACLEDCFCEAALYVDGTCNKQMLPLKYGRAGGNDTLLVKVGTADRPAVTGARTRRVAGTEALAVGLPLAGLSLVALCASTFLFIRSRRFGRYRRSSESENSGFDEEIGTLKAYSYEDLQRATDNFREELGRGAFGTVFKGSLSERGERQIAVKRLEKMVEEGEREFQREVRAIGRTYHRNLVQLLGFCNQGSNRLLVYDYMSNGSLADLLFKAETCPNWRERRRIALDVARGLQYLHEELESHIIHCDIKPQNILMDAAGTAKISDFGLAKLLMPDQTRTFTGIRGTRGYLAPEWNKNAPVTVKADVFSYGVVLLEIICCRRSAGLEEAGCGYSLAELAYECLIADELGRLSKDELMAPEDVQQLERMVKVGLWCVQNEPVFRPSMQKVILMIEGHLPVPLPPPPPSFSF